MTRKWLVAYAVSLVISTALFVGHTIAQDGGPQTTDDGLELINGRYQSLTWRPGATLDRYKRIVILDCFVEFRDNWLRDENRGKRAFNKVSPADVARIKEILADEFLQVVTEVVQEGGGYDFVNEAAEDVLILRPAILNVDVGAQIFGSRSQLPDTNMRPSMSLYLEFYDSATSELIGRALDHQGLSSNNRGAVRRVFRVWADNLRDTLEQGPNS